MGGGAGEFPCQGFSKAKKTPKNQLSRELLIIGVKMLIQIVLYWIILENAEEAYGSDEYAYAKELLEEAGFTVHVRVLCAADYGVPQLRSRTILVAVRNGCSFEWPAATHASPQDLSLRARGPGRDLRGAAAHRQPAATGRSESPREVFLPPRRRRG